MSVDVDLAMQEAETMPLSVSRAKWRPRVEQRRYTVVLDADVGDDGASGEQREFKVKACNLRPEGGGEDGDGLSPELRAMLGL